MRKLFSLVCTIFALYSAYVVEAANNPNKLYCNLTRDSPSMISASMFDDTLKNHSIQVADLTLRFQKFGDFKYDVTTCYLRTNTGGGRSEADEIENTYKISVKRSIITQPTEVYEGSIILNHNALLGNFNIDCPVVTPNVDATKVGMAVTLKIWEKEFTVGNDSCQFLPYKGMAESVAITSPINFQNKLKINIKNLSQAMKKGQFMYIGGTPSKVSDVTVDATLGATTDYYLHLTGTASGRWCDVNGEKNGAFITRHNGFILRIEIEQPLPSKADYVIECPDVLASNTSGSLYTPSISFITTPNGSLLSMATNTYITQ